MKEAVDLRGETYYKNRFFNNEKYYIIVLKEVIYCDFF